MKESSEESRWGFKASEVREIIVITLGILLAFGIEAAWTEFREKDEVRRQLTAVDAELAQNLRFLQDLEAEHRAVTAAGAGLLDIAGPDAQVEDPDSAAKLIGAFWEPAGMGIISQGALAALRASSLLAEVPDPDIREALASWSEQLRTNEEFNESTDQQLQEVISPLIHQYVSEGDLNRLAGFSSIPHVREEYRAMVRSSRFPSDYSGLMQDRQFENLVAQRTGLSLIGADIAADLQAEASRILALFRG